MFSQQVSVGRISWSYLGTRPQTTLKSEGSCKNSSKPTKLATLAGWQHLSIINTAIYNIDIQQCKVRDNLHCQKRTFSAHDLLRYWQANKQTKHKRTSGFFPVLCRRSRPERKLRLNPFGNEVKTSP